MANSEILKKTTPKFTPLQLL